MHLQLFILFFALCIFQSTSAFQVVIDPGHGGVDVGTSRDSFIESDIVFKIAQKIKLELDQNPQIDSRLTREKDQGLSLASRVEFANQLKADLFLSLHANASSSQQVSGMEFYFASTKQIPRKSRKPESVVEAIKQDLIQFGKIKSSLELTKDIQQTTDQKSVIRRAPFYVIENTTMPSVLIEVGFISNRREAKLLSTEAYQEQIAKLLASAIMKYQLKYKEKSDKNSLITEEYVHEKIRSTSSESVTSN